MFVNYRTTIWNQSTFAITRSQSHVSLHETVKPAGSVLSSLYVICCGHRIVSPPVVLEVQARRTYVLLLFKNTFVISVTPVISTSTGLADLHEICRICRTLAIHARSKVIFFDPARNVAMATNFVSKIDLHSSHLVVRITFARAAATILILHKLWHCRQRLLNYKNILVINRNILLEWHFTGAI